MEANLRVRWQAAALIVQQLRQLQRRRQQGLDHQLAHACQQLEVLQRSRRRLACVRARGWYGAARRLEQHLPLKLREATQTLREVAAAFGRNTPPPLPDVRQLLAEFTQLEDEFGELELDARRDSVSVTTEPILLEDVALGPFEIRLHLNELATLDGPRPYEVLALEPNPPSGNEAVTHPHVSDERLCEGEGAPAIRFALERGALGEFFLLVQSALNTYNPSSPYVALDSWHGVSCRECDDRVDPDEAYACSRCGDEVCGSCAGRCECCDEAFCGTCGTTCAVCHEPACDRCFAACPGCRRNVCVDCLAGASLCPDCLHEQEDEPDDHEEHHDDTQDAQRRPAGAPAIAAAAPAPASPAVGTAPAAATPSP